MGMKVEYLGWGGNNMGDLGFGMSGMVQKYQQLAACGL
jgi:hypothetical protein